jgi:hypothetical protein
MPKKKPEMMWIRPALIDMGPGRGKERARIPFQRGGVWRELKAEGELVPVKGREGGGWKRRLAEGGVEKFTPPKAANPKPKKSEAT